MAVEGTLPPAPENKVVAALRGLPTFYQAVMVEMRKVTWPAVVDVRRATIAIIIFVLLLGLLITIMDKILGTLLGDWIPSLFVGGR
jgi:preprotein translocase SecE subunit